MRKHHEQPQAAGDEQGKQSPRLRLNRRMKEILATGILPSLSPSAHTVLCYALAHGDFTSCHVFLGAKTIAKRLRWHRAGARRGIDELLAVGFLEPVKDRTNRQATVYLLTIVPELVEARRQRAAAVGAKRRKSDDQRAAEAKAKKRQARQAKKRQGAHGCAPGGLMGEPPGDSWVSPQGAHGCAPKHSYTVPSPLKERGGDRPSAAAEGDAPDPKRAARLRALRITRKPKASGLSAKKSSALKSLSRNG
jgi:DNA-binding MarR family transcriptional regulator